MSKLYVAAHHECATDRQRNNWIIMSTYRMKHPYFSKSTIPENVDNVRHWVKSELSSVEETLWKTANRFTRKIPTRRNTPPVYRCSIGAHFERRASQWYLNRIPWCPELSARKPLLAHLLEKQSLAEDEVSELSIHLSTLKGRTK